MDEAKPAAKPGLAARILILGVRGYQVVLGPLLGGHCRFTPTACITCHQDDFQRGHNSQGNTNCRQCHNTRNWD